MIQKKKNLLVFAYQYLFISKHGIFKFIYFFITILKMDFVFAESNFFKFHLLTIILNSNIVVNDYFLFNYIGLNPK